MNTPTRETAYAHPSRRQPRFGRRKAAFDDWYLEVEILDGQQSANSGPSGARSVSPGAVLGGLQGVSQRDC